jgi:hypothetical protein
VAGCSAEFRKRRLRNRQSWQQEFHKGKSRDWIDGAQPTAMAVGRDRTMVEGTYRIFGFNRDFQEIKRVRKPTNIRISRK